ncbi:MAG: hypothetical protein EBS75_01685 [Betaproteobacteria bacterium]|nr:hypothetical protein [Betaproteobacteria bacterium]
MNPYLIKGNPELAIPGANLSGTEQAGLRSLELLAQDKAGYQAQVAQWKQDLVAKPDAVNTWLSLALLHKAAGDYGEALQSFGEALRRGADQDARSLAEFAETIALARDKRFEGEPYELLKRAMTIDPNDSKVVSLMAAAHYQVGEKAQARALLEQLLAAMPPESAQAEQLRALIASLPGAASATERCFMSARAPHRAPECRLPCGVPGYRSSSLMRKRTKAQGPNNLTRKRRCRSNSPTPSD